MEIITTMVRFTIPTDVLKQKTEKSQWFSFGTNSPFKDVSIPHSKLAISPTDETTSEVVMPKWVYMKFPALQGFINDNYTEFRHYQDIDNDTFFKS